MNVIQIKNMKKYYLLGKNVVSALRGINLNVEEGEFVALMGESGCGKSTLLNCISGIIKIDDGKIIIDNQDISILNDDEQSLIRSEKIGYVFQFFNLFPLLSAIDNIIFPMTLIKNKKKKDKKIMEQWNKKAHKLLEMVNLKDRKNHMPSEMSGGEQQRVAIARALANDPKIILLDEPTGNLDKKTGKIVMEILKKLHENGNTLIIATHNENIASYCSRIIKLSDGKVIEENEH